MGMETTIAHGGTRRGDVLLCTPTEYHDLEALRRMRRALYELAGQSPDGSVSVTDLLYVLDGEQ